MATYAASISPELFARAADYRALAEHPAAVREPDARRAPFPWSERHLQCVWFDAALRPVNLRTCEGEPFFVENPGVWNLEAGPDFLGAAVRVGTGQRRIEGDVEIHIHPADWQAHGHAENPRYKRVRIHATYFPEPASEELFGPGTVHIPLRDALRANPYFSFDAIDLGAYPYAARQPPAPCREILARWTPAERARLLEAAGEERLRRKAERIAAAIREKGAGQVLYEEVLTALGYKHNKAPCRLLAERLPEDILRREARGNRDTAYAILLGVADLLPPDAKTAWDPETRSFVRRLWDAWWRRREKWDGRTLSRERWKLAGVRPANHPARRLMAAACLFTGSKPFAQEILALAGRDPATFAALAAELLESTPTTYWDRRLSFGGRQQARAASLVGAGRGGAIVSNVLAPFLAALDISAPFEHGLLAQLPSEGDNAIVRQTACTLFGRDHSASLYRSNLRRQGLVQIFHDYCLNDRSRCADCPLPAALSR
ncbi:MAG: DUF2851 family protein [Kiritimatiellae bacterium]|nr:DUF2851 family protein [Kiritimatiellia bacterium]